MTTGEILFVLLAGGAMVVFAVCLAYVSTVSSRHRRHRAEGGD